MKAAKLIVLAIAAFTAQSSFAQGWQIEGGMSDERRPENYQDYDEPIDQSDYDYDSDFDASLSFVLGYVNKTWNTDMDGITKKENFWGEPNKRLHGVQIGFLYQPSANLGTVSFGLSTGLCLETYFSSSPYVTKEAGYDRYTEMGTYIPLHAKLTIPLSYRCSLSLHGGVGMNLAIVGTFEEDHDYYDYRYHERYTETFYDYQDFGEGRYPKRLNFQTEYGASFMISDWSVNFTYSQGLTDHRLYKGYKTYQNKINIGVSYSF